LNVRRHLARAAALTLLMLAGAAWAGLPDLQPLKARYKITVNGVSAGTAAIVELRTINDTRKELAFEVRNRFFQHQESSRFDWKDCQLTPREYRHDFHGLGIDRASAIDFDWQRHIATESRGDKRREIALPSPAYDGLNMAMLARCRLRDGARQFTFPVLYRGERKEMSFRVVGNERVSTPVADFDTVLVERIYEQRFKRTRVWVAPQLDWFMVRFEHVENPAARGSLLLTEFMRSADESTAAPAVNRDAARPAP
jgi:hypothetical protein